MAAHEEQHEMAVRSWMLKHLGMVSEEEARRAAGFEPNENAQLPVQSVNLGRRNWYPVRRLKAYLDSQVG